jgi:hypothetical protein
MFVLHYDYLRDQTGFVTRKHAELANGFRKAGVSYALFHTFDYIDLRQLSERFGFERGSLEHALHELQPDILLVHAQPRALNFIRGGWADEITPAVAILAYGIEDYTERGPVPVFDSCQTKEILEWAREIRTS